MRKVLLGLALLAPVSLHAQQRIYQGAPTVGSPVSTADGTLLVPWMACTDTSNNRVSCGGGAGASSPTANAGSSSATAVPVQSVNGAALATAAGQPGVATDGSAAPANGTMIVGRDGSNVAHQLLTDTAGSLFVLPSNGYGMPIQGYPAAGVVDSGAPIKTGGYASSAAPTAVTAGQRVNAWYGLNGQTIVGGSAGVALLTSTTGVLAAPTAAVANSTGTVTALAAATSTTICPATTNPVVYEVQIYGTAPVLLGLDGQTLSSITPAAGSGAYMLLPTQYTLYVGPVARTNIITAYTATAQTVVCNIVTRQ